MYLNLVGKLKFLNKEPVDLLKSCSLMLSWHGGVGIVKEVTDELLRWGVVFCLCIR
jgi:hypothetical protein